MKITEIQKDNEAEKIYTCLIAMYGLRDAISVSVKLRKKLLAEKIRRKKTCSVTVL